MTERQISTPEVRNENYPEAVTVWQYSVDRPLSRDEIESIVEGTGVKIYTTREYEYLLGHGSDIYLGFDEESENDDPFPRASIEVTRRSNEKFEPLDGVDVSLVFVAKPSDDHEINTDLWETDRERIEAAMQILGGERVI